MDYKNALSTLVLFLTISLSFGQQLPSNWNYSLTGSNHTILILHSTSVSIDGQPIPTSGTFLGVFFETSIGTLQCGGYTTWTGATTNITAWAVDNGDDGFTVGDEFQWKMFNINTGWEYDVSAVYASTFPSSNLFAVNGMSSVLSLTASSIIDLEALQLISPYSSCGLSANEQVSMSIVSNSANAITDSVLFSYSFDYGFTWFEEYYIGNIAAGDTFIYTFSQTADFSNLSTVNGQSADTTYLLLFKVEIDGDLDQTNNMQFAQVTHMVPPDVYFTGLDTTYCYNEQFIVRLTGVPSNGLFSGTGMIDTVFCVNYMVGPPFAGFGSHEITYTYDDPITGCSGTYSQSTTIYQSPIAEIINVSTYDVCQYDTISLEGSPAGGSFGSTFYISSEDVFQPQIPGLYYISYVYTDENGCTDESPTDTFTVHPLPNAGVNLVSRAFCNNSDPEKLSGEPAGGVFSISGEVGVIGDSIYPNQLSPGNYQVTYVYTDANSCSDGDSETIRIFNVPEIEILGFDSVFCLSEDTITLAPAPSGGTWAGDISDSLFVPNTVGTYVLDYAISETMSYGGSSVLCTSSFYDSIYVSPNPEIAFNILYDTILQQPVKILADNYGDSTLSFEWGNESTSAEIFVDTSHQYHLSVENQYHCSDSVEIPVSFPVLEQSIDLRQGWNLISTYLIPVATSSDSVFEPIMQNLFIAKDESGNSLWPAYGYNGIGDVDLGTAYQLRMNQADTLSVFGQLLIPEYFSIQLPVGWSFLGYLRFSPAPIADMLAGIESSVRLVKNAKGLIYWPAFGVDQIGDMHVGQGYKINMYSAESLQYAPNQFAY